MKLNIVLVEPEIPSNTGNISRTCSVVDAALHLVHPLGFDIDEKAVRRAGLDYWDELRLFEYNSFEEVKEKYPDGLFFFCTTKAENNYSKVDFSSYGDREIFLVFGKETKGLPEDLLRANRKTSIRIPMKHNKRSLNLSNSVAIVAYEVLRQFDFENLEEKGILKNG
ncbi:MAG: tRNA (cytidine(34)-2'-O)-methyltransferase [Clostridia bacterium]|nr:tRNA (cytidine(34)-2'-O)-methyltransferase [Oscillospiraceae bacterium]MBQ7960569.1 tRNA (cytidine(34)-2'-O)-methyltransferase [Clostridia bacterium]